MKMQTWQVCFAAAMLAMNAPLHAGETNHQPTLDELLNLPRARQAPTEADPAAGENEAPRLDESVEKRLSAAEAADLFKQVVRDMDDAADKLGVKRDAGLPTQRLQEDILAKLDQVIAAARQQQQGGRGSPQPPRPQDDGAGDVAAQQGQGQAVSGQPDNAGAENPGNFSPGNVSAGDGSDKALSETKIEWGNLPPRLRDELQQGFGERFSPIYRDLTEAYYKRLAEEGK
jgi:hypothetical protein